MATNKREVPNSWALKSTIKDAPGGKRRILFSAPQKRVLDSRPYLITLPTMKELQIKKGRNRFAWNVKVDYVYL